MNEVYIFLFSILFTIYLLRIIAFLFTIILFVDSRIYPLIAVITTTILDRTLTSFFFAHEDNPIVAYLGFDIWIIITMALIVGLSITWFHFKMWNNKTLTNWAYLLSIFTGIAFVVNLAGLLLIAF